MTDEFKKMLGAFTELANYYNNDKLKQKIDDIYTKDRKMKTGKVLDKKDLKLSEDTEKVSDHKWVNKGKEGTHGTFKTKKEADAQRKAMFANGFSEDLEEQLNYNEIRQKFAEVIGGGYQPLIQQNGRFDFYNLRKNDADYIINMLRGQDFIEYIQESESGKYNFNNIKFNGMPERYYNVYGQIKE